MEKATSLPLSRPHAQQSTQKIAFATLAGTTIE